MTSLAALDARVSRIDYQLGNLLRNVNLQPALNDTDAGLISPGGIDTANLADGAVTTVKIGALAVTGAKIANATIVNANIANATIAAAKIASVNADAIVAGSGIINNLTINATLTIGAGGSIVDADGSTWNQTLLRLVSAGAAGDAFVLNTGGTDRAYVSSDSSTNAIFGLMNAATNPTSVLLSDGKAVVGFEGLSFNTLRPRVQVEAGGVAITGSATPTYGSGTLVLFIAEALVVPTTNPTGGIVLYVESGSLKARTSAGNVRTIAAV